MVSPILFIFEEVFEQGLIFRFGVTCWPHRSQAKCRLTVLTALTWPDFPASWRSCGGESAGVMKEWEGETTLKAFLLSWRFRLFISSFLLPSKKVILIRNGNKGIKGIRRVICNWPPDCTPVPSVKNKLVNKLCGRTLLAGLSSQPGIRGIL